MVAVDIDPEMVDLARERLPRGTTVIQSDLLQLCLPEPVDVIFSTAALHWVRDQDGLFARLATLLRPGGKLVAQCSGAGNIHRLIEAANAVAAEPRWRDFFADFTPDWYFPGPAETQQWLAHAGITQTRCWLHTLLVTPQEPLAYLQTIPLGSWLHLLPDEQRRAFTEQVAQRLGEPLEIEITRLNIDAQRA